MPTDSLKDRLDQAHEREGKFAMITGRARAHMLMAAEALERGRNPKAIAADLREAVEECNRLFEEANR